MFDANFTAYIEIETNFLERNGGITTYFLQTEPILVFFQLSKWLSASE
jgi:hypothetical protein